MTTPHPRDAEAWWWDDGNEKELAGHSIAPDEVAEVWEDVVAWAPNIKHRAGDWKMIGRTHGGRKLTIVVRYFSDQRLLRPITGWDCTDGEKTSFFGGGT